MEQQTWYLIDDSGVNQYYLQLQVNATRGRVQLNSYPVPTALPTNWTAPAGATWSLPLVAKDPQLTIGASDSGFGTLIGFAAGTYPGNTTYATGQMEQKASTTLTGTTTTFTNAMVGGYATFADATVLYITAFTSTTAVTLAATGTEAKQTTNITYNNNSTTYSVLGTTFATLSPVNTVFVNCNLVNNPYLTTNSQCIWAFNATGISPQASITYQIPEFTFLPVVIANTRQLTLTLTDQNGKGLVQNDTNANFTLCVRRRGYY